MSVNKRKPPRESLARFTKKEKAMLANDRKKSVKKITKSARKKISSHISDIDKRRKKAAAKRKKK